MGLSHAMQVRVKGAIRASLVHLAVCCGIALLAALLVFRVWFPPPYDHLSGGRELFLLLLGVDVVCGPLLTLVIFNPAKPRRELSRDLSIVALLQLMALVYGLHTAAQSRPLFLVHEVERFRVITQTDFQGADVRAQISALPSALRPSLWSGPKLVGVRHPRDAAERLQVMMESVTGGRDLAQRPDFYVAYDALYAKTARRNAKPLERFMAQFPQSRSAAQALVDGAGLGLKDIVIVPAVHREDWVVLLDPAGSILGFMPGDGFAVH